jgi:hypothetical protein
MNVPKLSRERIWTQIWRQIVELVSDQVRDRVLNPAHDLLISDDPAVPQPLHRIRERILQCPESREQDWIELQVKQQAKEDSDDPT